MSYTAVGICNAALAALGHDLIRDFDENNKKARLCEILYAFNHKFLLSLFDWPFARGFARLQKLESTNAVPTNYALYALPNDCIFPRDLHPIEFHYAWEQIQHSILVEEREEVFLYYTKNITNPGQFSVGFGTLLSALLAWKLSPAITQNQKVTKEMRDVYLITYGEVLQVEANIGSEYRQADETPENDTFVKPYTYVNPKA